MRTRAEIAPAMGGRRTWVAMRSPWSRNVLQRAIPKRFKGFMLMDERQCCSLNRSNVGSGGLLGGTRTRVSQNDLGVLWRLLLRFWAYRGQMTPTGHIRIYPVMCAYAPLFSRLARFSFPIRPDSPWEDCNHSAGQVIPETGKLVR